MVQAYPAKHLTPQSPFLLEGSDDSASGLHTSQLVPTDSRQSSDIMASTTHAFDSAESIKSAPENNEPPDIDLEMARPPYLHAMLAGGIGGTTGDMLMHSMDTVKTRQQGDPHMPPKYTSMGSSYYTILRQEGVRRGLYGGVAPAFAGSFAGTLIFFGSYEWSKRVMLDYGISPTVAYLAGGFFADLAASPLYVPTEVLKTRLQLQGRHDNPFFHSGYNYRSTSHALRSIVKNEGFLALFHGYKATLCRDLPFSALQFAFWEQEQKTVKAWTGKNDIGLGWEILTGASAGGMAGIITCPLDVVKTRIQTQQTGTTPHGLQHGSVPAQHLSTSQNTPSQVSKHATTHTGAAVAMSASAPASRRPISTSSPSTSLKPHSAMTLDTSSVIRGLRMIYQTEGMAGWFRGVGPRAVWTSVQSGTMLVMYQVLLRWFERHPLVSASDE